MGRDAAVPACSTILASSSRYVILTAKNVINIVIFSIFCNFLLELPAVMCDTIVRKGNDYDNSKNDRREAGFF